MTRLTENQKIEILKHYSEEKLQLKEIADLYHTSISNISSMIKRKGIPPRKRLNTNPKKINEELKNLIWNEFLTTKNIKQVCEKYNICVISFRKIRKEKDLSYNPKKINVNVNYFENIDSENKAYWAGFITADGYLGVETNNADSYTWLVIELAEYDKPHLEKFKIDLGAEQIIKDKNIDKEIKGQFVTSKTSFIKISRKKLCEDLVKYGITNNKSSVLSLPPISENLMCHYLRGLVDGDGCWYVDNNKNISEFSIVSPVYSYLEEVRDYLSNKCDLRNNVRIASNENGTCFSLRFNGNCQVKRIYEYLYNNDSANIFLDRKYFLIKNYFDKLNILKDDSSFLLKTRN